MFVCLLTEAFLLGLLSFRLFKCSVNVLWVVTVVFYVCFCLPSPGTHVKLIAKMPRLTGGFQNVARRLARGYIPVLYWAKKKKMSKSEILPIIHVNNVNNTTEIRISHFGFSVHSCVG